MLVHVFNSESQRGGYGFTGDKNGANLPADWAPWKYIKSIDMVEGETPRVGVDTEAALAAIEQDGFYLAKISISSTTTQQIGQI